ncbi:MAG: acyltransferase family protein, partial [Microthrixaceae bacterium]
VGMAALLAAAAAWTFVHEDDPWVLGWGLAAFSLVNVGLILGASVPGPMSSALSVAPLVWIGRLSYPIYLVHWPMALIMNPDRMGMVGWPLIALRSIASVLVAWAVFRWLETPLRSARVAAWPRGLLLWGIPASFALLLAIAVSGWGWA